MHSSTKLTLNGQFYSLNSLAKVNQTNLSSEEKKVLQFCEQWLLGQTEFSLYTSGSTGKPKHIKLSREQMVTSARLTGQTFNLQAGDKALVCLSTAYIAGMMMLVRGFVLGLDLTVITPRSNPLEIFSLDTQFDFTALVPLQLQQILNATPGKQVILNGMKAILVGGGAINKKLLAQLQSIAAPIYNTYGMTETVTHVAIKRLNGATASDYFTPLKGVEVAVDKRGCLIIKAAVTNWIWLYTNDLVSLKSDGRFKWLGRIDHVINSGGVKVHIEKVEAALEDVFETFEGGVLTQRRFFVGAIADSKLGETVVAIIEGSPFKPQLEDKIQTMLLSYLNKYEIPRKFYYISTLLKTPTGKINRKEILKKIQKEE